MVSLRVLGGAFVMLDPGEHHQALAAPSGWSTTQSALRRCARSLSRGRDCERYSYPRKDGHALGEPTTLPSRVKI